MNEDNDELFKRAAEHYPLNTGNTNWKEVYRKMHGQDPLPVQKKAILINRTHAFFVMALLFIPLSILDPKIIEGSKPSDSQDSNAINKNVSENKSLAASRYSYKQTGNNTSGHSPKKHYRSGPALSVAINGPLLEKDDRVDRAANIGSTPPIPEDPNQKTIIVPEIKDSTANKPAEEPAPKTNKAVAKKDPPEKQSVKKHVYIGLMVGLDISTVKLGSLVKPGFNMGLLAGYRLSKRVSLESGIFRVKKFYASEGKYFTPKNFHIPADAKLENLTGQCYMLEVPLNISYSFANRSRASWFATTGVSAYFMKSESYSYDVDFYGAVYPYYKEYDNPATNLFSVINVSAGYMHVLGRIGNLRIEPYIKIPVKKIGTGSLPIQSAGINIGLTKAIF